jgi:hypothetical protein
VGFFKTNELGDIIQLENAPINILVKFLTGEAKITIHFAEVEVFYIVNVLDGGTIDSDRDGEYMRHILKAFDKHDNACFIYVHDYSLSDNPKNRIELYIKYEDHNTFRYFYLPAKPLRID